MMPKSLAWILVLLALLPGIAHSADVTVKVTGMGATRTAALEDATRQAVQLALEQLVITDRKIVNDEIVRDETISTLNGFIKKRQILATRKVDGQVEVDAKITVSRKQVTNYIGDHPQVGVSQGTDIDGGTLGAEIQRQRDAHKALTSIMRRFIRGFPSKSVELRVEAIRLPQHNSNVLEIVTTAQISPTLVRALEATVKSLAVSKVRIARKFPGSSWSSWQGGLWGRAPIDLSHGTSGANAVQWGQSSYFTVCIGQEEVADCYLIPGSSDLLYDSSFGDVLVIGFQGLTRENHELFCIPAYGYDDWKMVSIPLSELRLTSAGSGKRKSGGLSIGTDQITLVSQIELQSPSLDKLEKIVPIAGIRDLERNGVIHDLETGAIVDACAP